LAALPYVEEALRWLPTESAAPVEHRKAARQAPSGTLARILIADDNADMRDYLQRLFGQSYQVEVVADGRAALERIQANPPDLVLADVMMPELDGFGLLAAIRGDATHRSIPVTLLSARAGEEARIEGLRAGADEYLVKPFSARELLACVASQLQLSRFRRETEQELRYRSEQYAGLLQKLAESESRLREADRRKDEFLALLAHELRNPLAPIRTGLELIRLAGDTPHAVGRVRMMMERQVDQMVRLIDDLLDVSRITSGKIVLQRSPRSLSELVQIAVDAQAPAIAARDIGLSVQLPELPLHPRCGCDALRADSLQRPPQRHQVHPPRRADPARD
jgi:DNA-binding response OmpR family regulator